jgi:hypothetical protein
MKTQKLLFFFILGTLFLGIQVQAQQNTVAAGGDATGNGGSVAYSVGQVFYTTATSNSGSVAQGVQQAFLLSEVLTTKAAAGISLTCAVYPNPTTDYLLLKVVNYDISKLRYSLFDIAGKDLGNRQIQAAESRIEMRNYPSGTYLLNITEANQTIKTIKIVKN